MYISANKKRGWDRQREKRREERERERERERRFQVLQQG